MLAHELRHTAESDGVLRRTVYVRGENFFPRMSDEIIPGETWKTSLEGADPDTSGEGARVYREMLRENRGPFLYAEPIEFLIDIRQRVASQRAMLGIEKDESCCSYGGGGVLYHLDARSWRSLYPPHTSGVLEQATLDPGDATLPAFVRRPGVKPSDAINAVLEKEAKTSLECNSMMVAIQYKGILDALGEETFNRIFSAQDVAIAPAEKLSSGRNDHPLIERFYESVRVRVSPGKETDDLVPGDWVYFAGHPKYDKWDRNGAWRGENALYVGDGKFSGFGLYNGDSQVITHDEIIKVLQDEAEIAYQRSVSTGPPPIKDEIVGLNSHSGWTTVRRLNVTTLRNADPGVGNR